MADRAAIKPTGQMGKQATPLTAKFLTDKSRLQEVYDLRVMAYEHSPKSVFVNRQIFPNGLFDDQGSPQCMFLLQPLKSTCK